MYTEDGGVYEAVIKSIDASSGTCLVRYLGYGNEETQQLQDLLFPAGGGSSVGNASVHSVSDMASEVTSTFQVFEKGNRLVSYPSYICHIANVVYQFLAQSCEF